MVSMRLPNVGVGDGIILNSSRDWDLGSGRGFVVGGMGGSMMDALAKEEEVEGGGGAMGADMPEETEGGGWEAEEEAESRCFCCSNIFSRAVLHLMRVGRGTLCSNAHVHKVKPMPLYAVIVQV